MTTTYTSVEKVRAYLGITSPLTGSTNPTDTAIERLINQNEDKIDRETNHAWRSRASGSETMNDTAQKYEYYDIPEVYVSNVGGKIFLKHRKILTLTKTTIGDALELWNGTAYIDYLTDRTEGRNNDYWLDYDKGILYIKDLFIEWQNAVRMKYRYGDTFVPSDIERCCTLMTVIDMIFSDDRSFQLPEGGSSLPYTYKVELLEREIAQILSTRREYRFLKRN